MIPPHLVRQVLQKETWLATVDLKDAFWHVPIHPRCRPYLAFPAGDGQVLLQGHALRSDYSPRFFTKIMQPVRARLVSLGVQVLMYINDWLLIGNSP